MSEEQFREDGVYYRVFRDKEGKLCVVTLQDFDEMHYDQSRFVTGRKFASLMEALDWLEDYKDRYSRQRGLRKSELRDAIIDLLGEHNNTNGERADQIIDLIQEMGMIPPVRDANLRSSYGYARIYEWENEDES